ncbi:unnamed protein product [Gemmataceae bacterium]|nr:unnamed protein product [Gemmataceae bacterium]VTT97957.1 unnamed protein product [Gemmataceae bacterium]
MLAETTSTGKLGTADFAAIVDAVKAAVSETLSLPVLLNQERAWKFLGVSRSAFFRLKGSRGFPGEVNVPGAGVHYRRVDLERWAAGLKGKR